MSALHDWADVAEIIAKPGRACDRCGKSGGDLMIVVPDGEHSEWGACREDCTDPGGRDCDCGAYEERTSDYRVCAGGCGARAKPIAPSEIDLACDAVIAQGEARGAQAVDALEDEHGSLYVMGLLHSDHDWAEDAKVRRFHLRAKVTDEYSDTYYEAFHRAAVTRAREIVGRWESLREGAAERASDA